MKGITDIHIHLVPGVDDGARNMEEAIEEIKSEVSHGVTRIIATPHSSAFDYKADVTRNRFEELKREVANKGILVELHLGCEILCYCDDIDDCIRNIISGKYQTMAGSKYVLIEFDPHGDMNTDALLCITKIKESGYIPIVAHVERYDFSTLQAVQRMREAGALIQINLYSITNDSSEKRRELTQGLLEAQAVDFVGTDAHRLDHRPPVLDDGIRWIKQNCTQRYGRAILHKNMDEIIRKACGIYSSGNEVVYLNSIFMKSSRADSYKQTGMN